MNAPRWLAALCAGGLLGLGACQGHPGAAGGTTAAAPSPVSAPAPTHRLRGLGDLVLDDHGGTGGDGGSWTTLTAADAGHAGWCASKFLADATALGAVRAVAGSGLPATVLALEPAGWWVLGVDGARFQALFAPTREALAARCSAAGASSWQAVAPRSHPAWLDCFDNAAVGFWVHGGGVLPKDLGADLQWFKDQGFTMCATGVSEGRLVAPGVLDTTVLDWFSAEAARRDVPWRMLLAWTAPQVPAFVRRVSPLPHIPDPDGPSCGAPGFENQARAAECAWEPVPAAEPWILDARRRLAAHAARDPRFIGHHVAPEFGHASLLGLERVAGLPATAQAWRAWLREVRRLDPAGVSLRHTGRADAWRDWDAVPLPRVRDFVGGDPAAALDLRPGAWEGRADPDKTGEAAGWWDPARDPGGWNACAANDSLVMMHGRGVSKPAYWLRRELEIPAAAAGRPLYLHISRNWWHVQHNRVRAWIDGVPLKDLTDHSPLTGDVALCLEAGSLAAGRHRLVLATGAEPVPSFIVLSPAGRSVYPFLGEALNRRWFDALEFAVHLRAQALESAMRATRQGDGERPMKVMAPGSHYDAFAHLFTRYGAYPHDTGQAGACWAPWTTSPVIARGGQHSSEPGGPADTADGLRDMFCRYLMLGDDAVDIVFHNDLYRTRPELAQWIADHRRLLACIGKGRPLRPQVAVLRSNRTVRLGIDTPYNWDITRGELQACGRTGQLVDLPDVAAGFADAYPVLFDAGSAVLDDDDLAAIEGYVRRGGTFVALHNTGMHSPERAHAWPISRLTGLRPKQDAPIGGKRIRFTDTQDLWPAMRGRELLGWGQVLDWTSRDVTGPALSLEPAASGVEAIATWQDGLGVAIARRVLGKGRVVMLGATFWRDSRDQDSAFRGTSERRPQLDQLLTALGVPRVSTTADPAVWAERWQAKNGILDLYPVVCMRTKPAEAVTGAVTVVRAGRPAAVWEVSQPGAPVVAASWADGRLVLPAVAAAPMVPRMFAAPRADIAQAVASWLAVQAGQWGALAPVAPVEPPPPAPAAEVLPAIALWSVSDGAPADGWQRGGAAVAGWRCADLGSFAAMGFADQARVCAVRRIAIPPAWAGRRVRLVFDAHTWFYGFNPHARLWLDGEPLDPHGAAQGLVKPRPDASFSLDVSAQAGDGELVLAVEVDARPAAKPGFLAGRPPGVTGVFYLRPEAAPVAEQALTEWRAGSEANRLVPAPSGSQASYAYLETRFTLPARWPASRLHLRAPGPGLNTLILNNHALVVTGESDRLEITGLVRREGENVLRWVPAGSFGGWPTWPKAGQVATATVPALALGWWAN